MKSTFVLQRNKKDHFYDDTDSLHRYARIGDVDSAVELLNRSSTSLIKRKVINEIDALNNSPLHYSARYNKSEICSILLKHGADPNLKDGLGRTALHIASKYYQTKKSPSSCIQVLINGGTDPSARDDLDVTALHYAAQRGSVGAVQELLTLAKMSNLINLCDTRLNTPLHKACIGGHHDVVRVLLMNGADIYRKNFFNLTPVHLACTEGWIKIVDLLLRHTQNDIDNSLAKNILSLNDKELNNPLHLAVENGHTEVVKIILSKIPNEIRLEKINASRASGEAVIHIAATFGYAEITKKLIEAGCNVNIQNKKLETPLFLSCANGKTDVADLLVKNNADISTLDWKNNSPLHIACFNGHTDTVKYILNDFKDEILNTNHREETCLIRAIKAQKVETVKFLLTNPSSMEVLEISDWKDNSPLHAASKRGLEECVKILTNHNVPLNPRNEMDRTPLHLAAKHGHVNVARLLLNTLVKNNGVPVYINAEDEFSETPLHMAAVNGQSECLVELLNMGANVNNFNANYWTPLESAASAGHAKCVKTLIDFGIAGITKSILGENALHLACKNGYADCVRLLLDWTKNVDTRLPDGRNCLDICIDNGFEDCVLVILEHSTWKTMLRNATLSEEDNETVITPMRKLVTKMPRLAEIILSRCIEANDKPLDNPSFQFKLDFEVIDDMFEIPRWKMEGYKNTTEKLFKSRTSLLSARSRGGSLKYKPRYGIELMDPDDIMIEEGGKIKKETEISKYDFVQTEKNTVNDDLYNANGKIRSDAKAYSPTPFHLQDNHLLSFMIDLKREKLLNHPLIQGLIAHKWSSFGRFVYIFNFIFYAIYMIVLNTYIVILPPPFTVNFTASEQEVGNGQRCFRVIPDAVDVWGADCLQINDFRFAIVYMIYIMASFQLAKEAFQIFTQRYRYFLNPTNYLEISMYVGSICVVQDQSSFNYITGIRSPWQWELLSYTVFISWINLLLFLQNNSFLGIYVLMFLSVFKTFLKFSLVVVFFLFAFAFSFYALLENQYSFHTFIYAFFKSFVMMAGDVDYNGIFLSEFASTDYNDKLFYNEVTFILYGIFVLVMTILVTNLLVGLAVGDIQQIQEQAELKRLGIQIDELLSIQFNVPSALRGRYVRRTINCSPNRFKKLPKFIRYFLEAFELKPRKVMQYLKEEEESRPAVQYHEIE